MSPAFKIIPVIADGTANARAPALTLVKSELAPDPGAAPMNEHDATEGTLSQALAQVAAGLARVYAERERSPRQGRLHRV